MRNPEWLPDLNRLLTRFQSLGVDPDLAGFGLCELWGLYCFLRHRAGE
jgi:hypothetical protein